MRERERFTLWKRARSFGFACRGLAVLVQTQHNAWIHGVATLVVVVAGVLAGVSRADWALLTLAMVSVWSAEALNTAVEALGDAVAQSDNELIGLAKDVAAGAVLVAAVGSIIIASTNGCPLTQPVADRVHRPANLD